MKEFKRFILLAQVTASEEFLKGLQAIPDCFRCSVKTRCPIQDKTKCPMKDLVGINTLVLGMYDDDDRGKIQKMIYSLYLLPTTTLLFLIDSQEHIGTIYKADGSAEDARHDVLTNQLRCFESLYKTSIRLFEVKDERNTMPPISNAN